MKEYSYHIGLQVRAYPSYKQKRIIRMNGGASLFIYNRLVAVEKELYQLKKTAPYSPTDMARLLYLQDTYGSARSLQNAIPFLFSKGIDSLMTANAIRNYHNAWNMYTKEPWHGMPAFHKKDNTYRYQTSCCYQPKKLVNPIGLYEGSVRFENKNHLVLPVLGRIRIKGAKKRINELFSRTCETRIGTITIMLDATGDCYITLALASDVPFHAAYAQTHNAVGIDMNLTNFLYDSDGEEIGSPRYLKQAQQKLKKAQRSLSRKALQAKRDGRRLQDCRNYQKQRKKLAECYRHAANQRTDFIRKTADREVKSHDYLFAEDLKVRNLLKNHKLAKAISDSGWRSFLTELQWCAEKRGKTCLLVNPRNTTQTCSDCGYVMHGDSRIQLGTEEWTCPQCGKFHIRDHNAAINIMHAGLSALKEAGVPVNIS